MQIKSLHIFCDIVRRRSFSRAANENGISQSSASQVVHQLEEHLGIQLLDRSKRPFVLTPAGEKYYEGCRQIVKQLSKLEEEVRAFQDEFSGRVTVASIYSVGLAHMSAFMQRSPDDSRILCQSSRRLSPNERRRYVVVHRTFELNRRL